MRFLLPLFLVIPVVALGCEGTDYGACVYSDDPAVAAASRDHCPPSKFVITTTDWRDVSGQVRRGENGSSAIVHVEPSADYAGEKGGVTTTVASDPLGFFGPIHQVALRYNISFRDGAEIISYQSVSSRYVQPSFEPLPNAPRFARASTATLSIVIDPPLPNDQTVTLFTSGDKVFDVFGTYGTGPLTIAGSEFTFPATIHALMHKKDGDLTTATAYARTDITAVANSIVPLTLRFDPITNYNDTTPKLDPSSSPDYVPGQVEVRVGYSRTSVRTVGIVDLNQPKKKFPAFPNHLYVTYRSHLVGSDGTVSDSGEKGFNPFGPESFILMPPAPKILGPAPTETTFKAGTELIASGARGGLYEHLFEPKSGSGSIRILTTNVVTSLPNLQKLGAANLDGEFVWTVRAYNEVVIPELFGGIDGRRWWRFSAAPPRTIRFAPAEN